MPTLLTRIGIQVKLGILIFVRRTKGYHWTLCPEGCSLPLSPLNVLQVIAP